MDREYEKIIKYCEKCFEDNGDTNNGVGWPNHEDALKRYSVMLDIIPDKYSSASLLDLGCGLAHLYEYILNNKYNIKYNGVDMSEKFFSFCKNKFPEVNFMCLDILKDDIYAIPKVDFIVMNGLFTHKGSMEFTEMENYLHEMLIKTFSMADKGIAFNVMSKIVDWEKDYLFHMPIDQLVKFIAKNLSRNFVIRHDYDTYDYTVYVYKK